MPTAEQLPCRVLSERLAGLEMFEHLVLLPELPLDVFAGSLEGHAAHLQPMQQQCGGVSSEDEKLFVL